MPRPTPDFQARSFAFACDIVRLYQILQATAPQPLARQVLRAGTSIGANLEEARAAQSRKDLIAKFSIALKEARETCYWLRLLGATSLAHEVALAGPLDEADQLVSILTASVRSLKRQRNGSHATPRTGPAGNLHPAVDPKGLSSEF